MIVQNYIDGRIGMWSDVGDERHICDVRAIMVHRLNMTRSGFEDAVTRLEARQNRKRDFIASRLVAQRLTSPHGVGCLDVNEAADLDDEFERLWGRDPLEAFLSDLSEVAHRSLGSFYSRLETCGVVPSPMSAGKAISLEPARSFEGKSALASFLKGKKAKWFPSVRLSISLALAGTTSSIDDVLNSLSCDLKACGKFAGFEARYRVAEALSVPQIRPKLTPVFHGMNLADKIEAAKSAE